MQCVFHNSIIIKPLQCRNQTVGFVHISEGVQRAFELDKIPRVAYPVGNFHQQHLAYPAIGDLLQIEAFGDISGIGEPLDSLQNLRT